MTALTPWEEIKTVKHTSAIDHQGVFCLKINNHDNPKLVASQCWRLLWRYNSAADSHLCRISDTFLSHHRNRYSSNDGKYKHPGILVDVVVIGENFFHVGPEFLHLFLSFPTLFLFPFAFFSSFSIVRSVTALYICVVLTLWWPSTVWTVVILTPLYNNKVAQVCRATWNIHGKASNSEQV